MAQRASEYRSSRGPSRQDQEVSGDKMGLFGKGTFDSLLGRVREIQRNSTQANIPKPRKQAMITINSCKIILPI